MSDEAIYNTLNMGIGLIFVVRRSQREQIIDVLTKAGEDARIIGSVVKGGGVELI
ncbi:MAG: hypothetical protein LBN35_03285 [Clostridiales Family XIII bacterium]|jgi:phosphoribosylaminoimidazole (AIR) synthetase|nr:hypothetical protein [Clostridiales Family XIII bacterium]